MRSRTLVLVVLVVLVFAMAGCAGKLLPPNQAQRDATMPPLPSGPPLPTGSASPGAGYSKVMVIVEENKSYDEVMHSGRAPYLERLAARYATAEAMQAGYPVECPSLAAYLLMTSGDAGDICDNDDPDKHQRTGPSIFGQVVESGRQWRGYVESMPRPCLRHDDGRYLVRHAPAPYYASEAGRCPKWDVPLGGLDQGALHDDLVAGKLPAYAMVTPDACNDMHGAVGCGEQVGVGDAWLAEWVPRILAAPDYRAGRLVVVVTFDEGSSTDNRIPTVVVAPTANRLVVRQPVTHCSMLRLAEEILQVPFLGCAADVPSARAAFGLA
jgi:hypothetical protein